MKKCINCQSDIENNAKVCGHCGANQPTSTNQSQKLFIIGAIIIIIILIISVCILANHSTTSQNAYKNTTEEKTTRDEEETNTLEKDEHENNQSTNNNTNTTNDNNSTNTTGNYNPDGKQAIKVYEFYGSTCSFCMSLNAWFQTIEDEYGMYFDLVKYEVWYVEENEVLMNDVAAYLNTTVQGVPFVVIGDKYVFGFNELTTPDIITKYIMDEYNKEETERIDVVASARSD